MLKPDWTKHLHQTRARELEMIFGRLDPDTFECAIELGAGDGFQSTLLKRWCRELVATDYNQERLRPDERTGVHYVHCDADVVARMFEPRSFDLVFSSNLLEHMPDPIATLQAVHTILRDDGVAIHVVPNRWWKICHMAFYNPNRVYWVIENGLSPAGRERILAILRRKIDRGLSGPRSSGGGRSNNLKGTSAQRRPRLMPLPHGVSRSNWQEFQVFSDRSWRGVLSAAGFDVLASTMGPFASGYGFGFDRARAAVEAIGVGSETIYVTAKRGSRPRQSIQLRTPRK